MAWIYWVQPLDLASPAAEGIHQQLHVQYHDHQRDHPGNRTQQARCDQRAHRHLVGYDPHQWDDRERQPSMGSALQMQRDRGLDLLR